MRQERRINRAVAAISNNPPEGDAIKEALGLLPLEGFIKPGDCVVITPNWVKAQPPETGTVVGPESLRQLIIWVKGWNPRRIVVATGSGGCETPQVMKEVGYDRIIEEEGVEFVDLNYGPYIEIGLNNERPSSTPINKLIEETDVLISYAQIKVHEEATVTLSIKNVALGWPPAEIHGFPKKNTGIHDNLHSFIAAMAEKIPIDLAILSGDKGMVGHGPSGGKAVDSNIVIAGTDHVAVDVIGCKLLGFMPQAVHYLYELIKRGVGEGDINKIEVKGIPVDQAVREFSQAAYGQVCGT